MLAWLLSDDIKEINLENNLDTKQIKKILNCKELDKHCVIDYNNDRSYIIWCSDDLNPKYGYIVIAYNGEGSEIVDMDLNEESFIKIFSM